MNSEDSTILTDRQLLEQILQEFGALRNHFTAFENRVDSLEQKMNVHFENFNQRLLSLEVQTETLTSLAYQALSIARAVKGDVRALREESSSHGREISELQRKLLTAA